MNTWLVYLLQCRDGSYYCGATNNIQNRVATHNKGKGAKYTKTRLPVTLLETSKQMLKIDALKLEYKVKKQSRKNKLYYLQKHSNQMLLFE